MHYTAMKYGHLFFRTCHSQEAAPRILDLGSQDVNGSLRQVAPSASDYVGADFVEGRGVDVILTDPYALPFENESFDACVSSSVFEHSEMFWLVFLEVLPVLRPDGLLYLNLPSIGGFHRYPVDCWRFYPMRDARWKPGAGDRASGQYCWSPSSAHSKMTAGTIS
jgi:SAM-dependent methyltransferase